jgi:hypothetical protein
VHESLVPRQAVVAWSLWFIVGTLTTGGLIFLIVATPTEAHLRHWGFTLLLTAGVLAPAAAVAHIRLYTVRVCNLIRNTNGLRERDDLRAVR